MFQTIVSYCIGMFKLYFTIYCVLQCYVMSAIELDVELKSFDELAYENWPVYSIVDKLPYLLDEHMKMSFENEFNNWLGESEKLNTNVGISQQTMVQSLTDFRTPEEINEYFLECDVDGNGLIDIVEFVVCRGYYDSNTNPYGLSEYDFLESIIIHDYEEKRNDPNVQLPGYKYDEDGIIID